MDTERTLLLLRHGKAAGEPGVDDINRPLTPRGQRDASAAGQWLRGAALAPERVVCSPVRRAKETWEHVSSSLGRAAKQAEVTFDQRVYDADAAGLLELVREFPDTAGTVLMLGHNPAALQLVLDLTAHRDLFFPTCALAVIRIRGSWADAAPRGGQLMKFWSPHRPT
ncbi:MAG TPA: histidine phosphatase family protein [Streptosporangiaceae bacterium]